MEINPNGDSNNEDQPVSLGMAAMDLSWLFCSTEEQRLITIKCGKDGEEKTFTVLKPILTKHSKFFRNCLRNPCKESASSTIELPEVTPGRMMLYLTLAHRQALMKGSLTNKALVEFDDFATPTALECHVKFYQLCDFLQNQELAASVQKMILDYLKALRNLDDETESPSMFSIFGRSFHLLESGHIVQARLRRALVKSFCLYVNAAMYFKHCSRYGDYPDFLMEISKQYVLNAMWNDPAQRTAAKNFKTQRMLIDDVSESEAED
ncbi:hypothetical protein K4K59_006310 [Colletotrichum sp. SAR11_240]|nr:hypothetical protein K4K59_006310 [Colletotrichum sp. SAR11_240]